MELVIEGISIKWDEIVAYTCHSSAYSDAILNCEARWINVETAKKAIRVEQEAFGFFVRSSKDRGEALIHTIQTKIVELVHPHLMLNFLVTLARGATVEIGPFILTSEGISAKSMFGQKFCSWDWDIRCGFEIKGLGFWSPASGYNTFWTISYRCAHTGLRMEVGKIKSDARNAGALSILCLLLGNRDDEDLDPSLPALKAFLWFRRDRFADVPPSSMRRRLESRFFGRLNER